jgi:hypothetical protein
VAEELTAEHPEEIEDFRAAAGYMEVVEDDGDKTKGIRFQDQPSDRGWKLRMNPSLRSAQNAGVRNERGRERPNIDCLFYSEHDLRAVAA